jgi:hypothetical protein
MQLGERQIRDMVNSSPIVQELFIPELRRLDEMLNTVITRNGETHAVYDSSGFMYQGEFYLSTKSSKLPMAGNRLMLADHLLPDMQEYLYQVSKLMLEVNMVNQMVFRLVQGCKCYQDVRDALPDCLITLDKTGNLIPLTRTRKAAFTLVDDAMCRRQYEKVLPIIEYYSGTHLIF